MAAFFFEGNTVAKELFVRRNFNNASMATIAAANDIIDDYLRQGYTLTLRQLYYQFVARGLMENKQRNYKNLGELLSNARLAGLVDWNAMEDRTRNLSGYGSGYNNVADYISGIASGYAVDLWEGQTNYVEVWVEKEALAGVVERACAELRISHFSCRGYVSQSEQYSAGKRFARKVRAGLTCTIFHLGDHDPSGLDMTRDNQERLRMFSRMGVRVRRLALNMDQVEELNPPPNPAKETDSRHDEYVAEFGDSSWELDALDPDYINNLVAESVKELVDEDRMNEQRAKEAAGEQELQGVADNWDDIRDYMIANDMIAAREDE